jgi:glutathione synthase
MKWLFVIDPIEELNYDTDSTYAIMKEASRQDIDVNFCRIQDLFYDTRVKCISKSVTFNSDESYRVGLEKNISLDDFDIVFMRKDPPYDINYHHATILLSLTNTLVVNSPNALRDFNEKLIILSFKDFIPETIVTSNETHIKSFLKAHPKGLILKSLQSYQGRSVVLITKENDNAEDLLITYTNHFTTPVIIQEYLPQVRIGDKRILVLGGEILGAVLREPLKNSYLANLGQGGIAKKTTITHKEKAMVNEMSDFLLKNGLHFVGLDVIGDRLTEINITCPTGIVHINKLNGVILEKSVVEYFMNLSS